MLGWFRLARTCASRWNRAKRSGSGGKRLGQDLQRDITVELRIRGTPDFAHPAFTGIPESQLAFAGELREQIR